MIWWTGLAPWKFEFPFPGSLVSTVLGWKGAHAEQPAPAPHLARPAGCAAPRIVLVTVPRGSRSIRPDGLQKCHAFLSRFRRLCRSVESFQPVQEVVPSVPVQEVGAISSLQ